MSSSTPKIVGLSVAMVVIVSLTGLVLLRGTSSPQVTQAPSTVGQSAPAPLPGNPSQDYLGERTKGSADAPVTIYELSDFQCPYCRQFFVETYPALEREYLNTGKAKLIFVNLPLASIHPNAPAAHEFAMCAARQDRFWPIHDVLFARQPEWARLPNPAAYFASLANQIGLDQEDLSNCLQAGSVRSIVQGEFNEAVRSGITSTPAFVIGRGLLSGFVPIDAMRPILDSIYAAATAGNTP